MEGKQKGGVSSSHRYPLLLYPHRLGHRTEAAGLTQQSHSCRHFPDPLQVLETCRHPTKNNCLCNGHTCKWSLFFRDMKCWTVQAMNQNGDCTGSRLLKFGFSPEAKPSEDTSVLFIVMSSVPGTRQMLSKYLLKEWVTQSVSDF